MKTQNLRLSITALSVLVFCSTAHAVVYPNPLAQTTRVMAGNNFTAPTFNIRLGSGFGFGITGPIFDSLSLSAANVGQTFYITQAQDSDFNTLVGILQNGASNPIELDLSFNNFSTIQYGLSANENFFWAPLPPGNNGIDFQGFPIDNIAMRLDSVSINGSAFSIQATFFVNSAPVPEPAAASLALLGGAAWLYSARRRKA